MIDFSEKQRTHACRVCLCLVWIAVVIVGCGEGDNAGPSSSDGSPESSLPEQTNRGPAVGEDPPLPVAVAAPGSLQITPAQLHARLKEKNPQYKKNAQFGQREGQIVAVSLQETAVSELSALRGLKLQDLDLYRTGVSDLFPLTGMPLVKLMAEETLVADIGPLKGMPLKTLWLNQTKVTDLSPLDGMPIVKLNLCGTQVEDISVVQSLPLNTIWLRDVPVKDFSPLEGLFLESIDAQGTSFGDADLARLKGMPLKRLNIAGTKVTDLTPLKSLQLTRLIFTPNRIRQGLDVVRSLSTLTELDVEFDDKKPLQPAAFWKKFDAGAFNKPE